MIYEIDRNTKIINLEKEFFRITKDLESKREAKQEFLKRINNLSEDWINNKFRFKIGGLQ